MSDVPRPHGGRWFEELTPGLVIHHRLRRTITEADNVMFTTMTMNPAALHLDFEYARTETQFGKPLVNSMFTAAVVVGISVHETTHGTTVANLGFERMGLPCARLPRRHAAGRERSGVGTPVQEQARPRHHPVRAPCPQPGRHARGHHAPQRPHVAHTDRTAAFLSEPQHMPAAKSYGPLHDRVMARPRCG